MADVLLEEVGPNGNVQAVVESDEHVCYFYLFGAPDSDFGMKAAWVRNHTPAIQGLDGDRMRAGLPPRNPAPCCRHPAGLAPPEKESLRVVWLPEGNGAALYEGREILAIIPPWSGTDNFNSYARDAIGEGPTAWELSSDNALLDRLDEAEAYWRAWDDQGLWTSIQSSLMTPIEETLGAHSNYYAIDGGDWPPKALIRIPYHEGIVLVTIGMSARPQPNVELVTDSPELWSRIELGVVLPGSWSKDAVNRFATYLSGQSGYPWSKFSWLGPGHTFPCDSWLNPKYTMALLSYDHPAVPAIDFEPLFDDPINVLWFLPITDEERTLAMNEGSERLAERLSADRWKDA